MWCIFSQSFKTIISFVRYPAFYMISFYNVGTKKSVAVSERDVIRTHKLITIKCLSDKSLLLLVVSTKNAAAIIIAPPIFYSKKTMQPTSLALCLRDLSQR